MDYFLSFRRLRLAAIVCLVFTVSFAFSDEWKARHPLISPTGVMNLSELPLADEIFFAGPQEPSDAEAWRAHLKAWRAERLIRLRYDGSQYERPELAWTQKVVSQVQLLVWDRSFYDPETGEYTVDKFLSETENRIGPIDAVLIWPVYPNLGVDDRNQFDMLRDLPGGVAAVRQMVDKFHSRGVKVFFPILAWDSGTRDEGTFPWVAISRLLADINADGINFDTLESIPAPFRQASDATGHPLALEPQFDIRDETEAWSNIGWNDWVTWEGKEYPFIPMVSKTKWFEPRHMVSVTDRFTRDKTDSLQHAFFNGQGYATLDNLWGFWYGTIPHDAEAILRFTRIERAFTENLNGPNWEPHTPTLQVGVFASKFPTATNTLWTVINRNEYVIAGEQIRIVHRNGIHYYDLWHGTELTPVLHGNEATLSFAIDGLGFGAILATDQVPSSGPVKDLLAYMAERSRRPLSAYSRDWTPVPQTIVEIPATSRAQAAPAGMVRIPEADYDFQGRGIEIEGGNDPGVDVQYPWEDIPRRFHRHRVHVASFFIDRTPVTNAEFKKFLDATSYHPKDDHNFLRDWKNGRYPEGWEKKPVTWVSIEDARAYAKWAGKRLPHEWEWQLAAQSTDGRLYPWGDAWKPELLPAPDRGRTMRPLANVDAFPQGASSLGVLDLEGNVSQWTDEFRDPHTRAAIVRGGASYQPTGSIWYFPQTYRLDEHEKYLLMSPGRDRAGTIGFRCVVDAQ
ncbi:MAG: SUMF1/EgtB/PvdO family nonheme iron enzyme [Terriglobales bacterium]